MSPPNLIGIDQTENAVLRRRLRPWLPSDMGRVRPLVHEILCRYGKDSWSHTDFQWETNVYPLFYYGWQREPESRVYQRITDRFCEAFSVRLTENQSGDGEPNRQDILSLITSVANAEIDLLIESSDYFIFVEAKTPPADHPAHFQKTGKMHQLVRQLVEGLILAKMIGKSFMLATLGCGPNRSLILEPGSTDKRLLELLGATCQPVPNLSWDLLSV